MTRLRPWKRGTTVDKSLEGRPIRELEAEIVRLRSALERIRDMQPSYDSMGVPVAGYLMACRGRVAAESLR